VKKLEADLEEHGKELSTLKGDREKTLHTLAEMQVAMSDKTKQLSSADDAIADLRLKLDTLEKSLEDSRARERALSKDLQDEKNLLKSATAAQVDYEKGVTIWTERLIDAAEKLTAQLASMGLPSFRYSSEDRISPSARLTMFFESTLDALKLLQSTRATQLANETRQLCRAVLRKVLIKVVHSNPGIDLTSALGHLPKDADVKALEELVAPILEKVDSIKRIEGQRRD
jgi:septal ring factor EnvC (AmiA/AmiB activator)